MVVVLPEGFAVAFNVLGVLSNVPMVLSRRLEFMVVPGTGTTSEQSVVKWEECLGQ
jgi:hypothetical protein